MRALFICYISFNILQENCIRPTQKCKADYGNEIKKKSEQQKTQTILINESPVI